MVVGLSFGTAGNSATIHGSSGLYRRDQGAYSGRSNSRGRYPSYGGYSPSSGSADEVQKETKYYYGGKYQGRTRRRVIPGSSESFFGSGF